MRWVRDYIAGWSVSRTCGSAIPSGDSDWVVADDPLVRKTREVWAGVRLATMVRMVQGEVAWAKARAKLVHLSYIVNLECSLLLLYFCSIGVLYIFGSYLIRVIVKL